jgi:hypothetical protein
MRSQWICLRPGFWLLTLGLILFNLGTLSLLLMEILALDFLVGRLLLTELEQYA